MKDFLNIDNSIKLYSDDLFFIIEDKYPVSPGHLLIISSSLVETFFDLTSDEKLQLLNVIEIAKEIIDKKHSPDGYNIGMNCGKASGQTIFHFHCHLIPRYNGDLKIPDGGVRGVIPDKRVY
ncbi:HIT family protein [Aestuariibaculum suncheonense]|uniref:HIT family protein n=1 Tax=Aestuariibaculum suncheonense TaxID=1028745 RepID=A0A8J6Q669_9FLAO|nr:HIT family protein [Aestuariibaculum suncheonense]MBD0834475.1 HIT family protein [Aestuariibaculum suncheonense]